MSKIFDWQLVFTEIPALLKYLPVTLQLTGVALIIGWVIGLLIAVVKIHNVPILRQLCTL
ncbi:MAG TPA: amino acid ABC transporter permease, partial [Lachnoclostridium sp.]|nr:amino acid ABC transporter permease [Lachnoclostridium sp.]